MCSCVCGQGRGEICVVRKIFAWDSQKGRFLGVFAKVRVWEINIVPDFDSKQPTRGGEPWSSQWRWARVGAEGGGEWQRKRTGWGAIVGGGERERDKQGMQLQVKIKQSKPRWNWCKLFSSTPLLPPVMGTVSQARLVMKGKIFYSDLLIWKWSPPVERGTVLLNLSSLNHTLLTLGFICFVGVDSRILPKHFLVERPGILNRMKRIPTRNSLFINANYTRKEERGGTCDASEPRGLLSPISVICYLHLYTFFSFNKRRPGFSVTFMDSLF